MAKLREFLKLAVGRPLLGLHRELLKCRVAAEGRSLRQHLAACGTALEIVHPWDIRGGQYVSIGDDTFIGPGVLMIAWENARIRIGSKVMFGPRVRLIANDHRIDTPATAIKDAGYGAAGDITIADGVWIGAGATILKGVSIGRGAVVGAGAVVTKSVAAGEIWAGNPARKIRSRPDAAAAGLYAADPASSFQSYSANLF